MTRNYKNSGLRILRADSGDYLITGFDRYGEQMNFYLNAEAIGEAMMDERQSVRFFRQFIRFLNAYTQAKRKGTTGGTPPPNQEA